MNEAINPASVPQATPAPTTPPWGNRPASEGALPEDIRPENAWNKMVKEFPPNAGIV